MLLHYIGRNDSTCKFILDDLETAKIDFFSLHFQFVKVEFSPISNKTQTID